MFFKISYFRKDKKVNLFYRKIHLFQTKIGSEEECEEFRKTKHGFHVDKKSCPIYCCGDCDSRYCCTNQSKRVDPGQSQCIDTCQSYTNFANQTVAARKCSPKEPFCCGNCRYRSCCKDPGDRIYQNDCNVSREDNE